jgi:hypothetical protein
MEHHRSDLDPEDLDIDRDPESAENTLLGDPEELDTSIEEEVDERLQQEND